MKLSEELAWRGFVNQTTYKDLSILDDRSITFYWGVDPSSDSMTIGNLAAAMMVKAFKKHGHHPVLLVGGATGLIGDPDGKAEERTLKTQEEIDKNKQAIVGQYHQIFGNKDLDVVDNYDWFKDMRYLEFLRYTGKHVPMRQMLAREFVQTRLGEAGSGISYAEFSYVLIQAYDFLHLYKNHDVTLQLCGSDQWGNSIAGVDLIRRELGGEAHVFSAPLVLNKSTGQKFGKSEAGAVWLDGAKTSPNDFYQFWVNVDDAGVEDYIKVYTEFSKEEVDKIINEFKGNKSGRLAQKTLAYEVTKLVYGESKAEEARNYAGELMITTTTTLPMHHLKVSDGSSIVDALVESRLASSKTEARQLLADGGIYINDKQITKENFEAADFSDGFLKLRRGKRLENTKVVELEQ